jgi:diphosphomevalonate decarboxylase
MKITWRSPSNLAIVKYWGKYGRQLPKNASISLTLDNAYSETSLSYEEKEDDREITLDFFFEDKVNESFKKRILKFLNSIVDEMPFLKEYHLTIHSKNSFPHSAGIASSASSMSALALCLCQMEREVAYTLPAEEVFYKRASYFSRLASGSACRSIYPYAASWGKTSHIDFSSDEFATPCADYLHDVFKTFHDDILIISQDEKSVSSSAGHELMEGNPFAPLRYQLADRNLALLMDAFKQGDLDNFGKIAEEEALMLHALMMTSDPSYILMEANSIEAIKRVRNWRADTGKPLYFSLDAGPNLHLLYPDSIVNEVKDFIKSDLSVLCQHGRVIEDRVGKGAVNTSQSI